MHTLEEEWERRSKEYGNKVEGVMLKSLPRSVNEYLHKWQTQQISGAIEAQKNVDVLDIGCGYGRLSKEILRKFPKAKTVGVDISQNYVNLYNKNLKPRGRAIKGDIERLPFKKHTFDVVVVVTTFLYVTGKKEQEQCLKQIFQLLRPGGSFVIIDVNTNGYSYITLGGLVAKFKGKNDYQIPTYTFDYRYLASLITKAGGKISRTEGVAVCTLLLPLLIILGHVSKSLTKLTLKLIEFLDRKFAGQVGMSVYVSYVGNV